MRVLIRSLDALLRRGQRIHEFSHDPDCVFRIRLCRAPRPLRARSGEIPEGAPVVELHFWNEHLPRIPEHGAQLGWATRGLGRVKHSLGALARHLREVPHLRTTAGVIGFTAFASGIDTRAGERVARRLGFECEPYRCRTGRIGEIFENMHTRAMLWAFNEPLARERRAWRIHRMLIWMPADELVRRYAPPEA